MLKRFNLVSDQISITITSHHCSRSQRRPTVISTDFKFVSGVETTWAPRLPAAVRLPRQGGPTTMSAVGVPDPPFHRDRRSQGPRRHFACCGLRVSYGVGGPALDWFQSYLTGRTECVWRGVSRSTSTIVRFGVPQGSVLGPLLFVLYTADLIDIIEAHGFYPHLYANDTQIQGSCRVDRWLSDQRGWWPWATVPALILFTCSSPLSQTALTRFLTGCTRIGYS